MIGGVNRADPARNAVSVSIERSEVKGQNCFGKLLRETGQRRVPEPPERITGTILLSKVVKCCTPSPLREKNIPSRDCPVAVKWA